MSKAAKRRMCPAVGREISPAECGENRASRYACPVECPHNPFAPANYDSVLQIEDAVNDKSFRWLRDHALHPGLLECAIGRLHDESPAETIHRVNAVIAWAMFFERDTSGLTCAERWERAGFAGLKNDERVTLRGRMQSRIALIEVRRVLDQERTEVVDLLAADGKPMIVVDRSLAAMAVRFSALLSWIYPLPHCWRINGAATEVREMGPFDPAEVITEVVQHLGGPLAQPDLSAWLAQNSERFSEALSATALARRQQMFAGIDAQFGKVVYELQASFDECRATLDAVAMVAEDDLTAEEQGEGFREARVWFADDDQALLALPAGARPVLGRVLLGPKEWRIEAMSAERTATLRKRFETQLGAHVRFVREAREDLSARLARKDAPFDAALVPPRLLEQPERIELTSSRLPAPASAGSSEGLNRSLRQRQDREFPGMSIPALDGRTPREAARDPVLRPRLARLLKARIRAHDEENLRTGRTDDINWLPRELGMEELIFDPPPPRPRLRMTGATPEGDITEAHDGPPIADRPAPPSLPAEPFTGEQAMERLRNAMTPFDTAAAAVAELEGSGSTLMEDVEALTGDALNDEEFGVLAVLLLHAWFALVPPGRRAPELSFEALSGAWRETLQRVADVAGGGSQEVLKEILRQCRQPALTSILMADAMEARPQSSRRIRQDGQLTIALVLLVVVNELDRALRAAPARMV